MATKQTILYYTCSAYHSALTRTYVVKQLQNYVSATLLLSTNVSMTQFRKDFFMEQKKCTKGVPYNNNVQGFYWYAMNLEGQYY